MRKQMEVYVVCVCLWDRACSGLREIGGFLRKAAGFLKDER